MAACKKGKTVKQKETPIARGVRQAENPDYYYNAHPSWNFASCDTECWPFSIEYIGTAIWTEIIPKFRDWESQTWNDILLKAKKQNHAIDISMLSSNAQKRLDEKLIEPESIISLRLSGTHRLYGFMAGSVFNILWYDSNHGDNSTCVCRSHKKHT